MGDDASKGGMTGETRCNLYRQDGPEENNAGVARRSVH